MIRLTSIAKYFAKIDVNSAYNQIEIDKKFKEIPTIYSPIGLLRLKNIYIIRYQNNIWVRAFTKENLKCKTKQILKNSNQVGMTINKDKSELGRLHFT